MASKSQIPYCHLLVSLVLFIFYVIVAELTPSRGWLWLKIVGLFLMPVAAVFIFYPFCLLRRHGKCQRGSSYLHTQEVVTNSLYSIVRHPQYLGYILLVLGFMCIHQNWICTVIGVTIVLSLYLQAKAEEEHCIRKFGDEYLSYMRRVPRFNVVLGIMRRMSRS